MLFTFFNLFLNQFRAAISISLCTILLFKNINNFWRFFILALAIFCHFFVGLFFILFFLWNQYGILNNKVIVVFLLSILLLLFLVLPQMSERFQFYLNKNEISSLKYLLVWCILIINRKFLDSRILLFLVIASIASFFLRYYTSLSTRLSEMLLIILILTRGKFLNSNKLIPENSYKNVANITLLISVLYFVYSFFNMIIVNGEVSLFRIIFT